MSLSEDMRAMKDNTKIKDGRSRLYLKNGYIDYPSRLEILDLAGCDDNCTYLGAVEVSEVHAPVAIFRSPFAPGEMPDEFRQGIEEAYYYQFPDVHKKIEEPKGAKVPPTLGVFILPPGRKKEKQLLGCYKRKIRLAVIFRIEAIMYLRKMHSGFL